MRKLLLLFLAFSSLLFASKPFVTVTILPQKYFVQKIVKDKFDINVMVAPGSSPHNFEPKPSQMRALANSKAFFLIGEPSEKAWIEKFKKNAKDTLFVDTTKGLQKIEMKAHNHHDDKEDDEHEHHSHNEHHEDEAHEEGESLDPHIWLDPILVKIQAKNIFEAMVKIDEKNSSFYKENYEGFLKELDDLNSQIKTILAPFVKKEFMVFHPSWGYFALRYDLTQLSIEIEGKEPKPSELVEIIKDAKEHNIKIVFVSPQFSQKSAQTLSQNIGANIVAIDPLSLNWSESLLQTAHSIANSYK